jgi:hypothetical protein
MTKIVYEDVKLYIEGFKEMARVLLLSTLPDMKLTLFCSFMVLEYPLAS